MGIDTKLFIECKQDQKQKVFDMVLQGIMKLKDPDHTIRHLRGGKNSQSASTYGGGTFSTLFKYAGEERQLSINTDCDSDYGNESKSPKVILSLGCWGRSVEFMVALKDIFCETGYTVFLIENDCSSSWVKYEGRKELVS